MYSYTHTQTDIYLFTYRGVNKIKKIDSHFYAFMLINSNFD